MVLFFTSHPVLYSVPVTSPACGRRAGVTPLQDFTESDTAVPGCGAGDTGWSGCVVSFPVAPCVTSLIPAAASGPSLNGAAAPVTRKRSRLLPDDYRLFVTTVVPSPAGTIFVQPTMTNGKEYPAMQRISDDLVTVESYEEIESRVRRKFGEDDFYDPEETDILRAFGTTNRTASFKVEVREWLRSVEKVGMTPRNERKFIELFPEIGA